MSTITSRNRGRAGRLLHLIASITIVVALVLMPPVLPHFGPSLATPLTTSTLSQVALLLAWIVLLILALALLQHALASTRALLPPAWATRSLRRPTRVRSHTRREEPPPPRLLVAHPATLPSDARVAAVAQDALDETMTNREVVATVALLGPVRIDGVRRPRRATTLELLAYLALHPAGASRDELLEAMWPGEDPRRTRPRLWQGITEARRLLGDAFERDGDRYKLDRARVETDVDKLARLLTGLEAARSSAEASPIADRALGLWRGAPLAGSDYAWADAHNRQLEATLAKLAERVARARLATGDAHGALRVAEQGLALDNLNETFVRIALEAEGELGRRESMTERYEALGQLLEARLGLEPERETRVLYRQLLGQG